MTGEHSSRLTESEKKLLEEADEEIDRLRTENAKLKADAAEYLADTDKTIDNLRAENERLKAEHITCPCQLVEPCHARCSCANSIMSGGCRRCCRYGSDEQQMAAAKTLVAREAALALKDAALDAGREKNFGGCPACGARRTTVGGVLVDQEHYPSCWWEPARKAGHE